METEVRARYESIFLLGHSGTANDAQRVNMHLFTNRTAFAQGSKAHRTGLGKTRSATIEVFDLVRGVDPDFSVFGRRPTESGSTGLDVSFKTVDPGDLLSYSTKPIRNPQHPGSYRCLLEHTAAVVLDERS